MKNLFTDSRLLDAACRERWGLTEEIMMENAAAALEREVLSACAALGDGGRPAVLILCGGGNNGADGYALARRLAASAVAPCLLAVAEPKSPLCISQAERARRVGVPLLQAGDVSGGAGAGRGAFSVLVDCIFGSGFHGDLSPAVRALLAVFAWEHPAARRLPLRIACDVPTGLREDGTVAAGAFCADITVTMGAEKLSLYSDEAKDITGRILVGDLGLSRALFEQSAATGPGCPAEAGSAGPAPAARRLEESDLLLPLRARQNVHKGSFGHLAVASGEKPGASCIAGTAALRFGAGLVTLVGPDAAGGGSPASLAALSPELMAAAALPEKSSALALGMGLGRGGQGASSAAAYFDWLKAHPDLPCLIDADALYAPALPGLLSARAAGCVLTPHAKEFAALLALCGLAGTAGAAHAAAGSRAAAGLSAEECLARRPQLMEVFCRKYPGAVLLVKGANVMIGCYRAGGMELYVNPLGSAALAKAGSGDVLAGLIAALLAQKYGPLEAAISGSLAHALASRRFAANYALSPLLLMDAVAALGAAGGAGPATAAGGPAGAGLPGLLTGAYPAG